MTPSIVVAAAVIERSGRFLVTRRQRGIHLEGYWEFPGGKCGAHESLAACMARELREELAVDVVVGREVLTTIHEYEAENTHGERRVELHFLRCELCGEPAPQQGQEMRWVTRDELKTLTFPPADLELLRVLTA